MIGFKLGKISSGWGERERSVDERNGVNVRGNGHAKPYVGDLRY
jgi:hypothetical protein